MRRPPLLKNAGICNTEASLHGSGLARAYSLTDTFQAPASLNLLGRRSYSLTDTFGTPGNVHHNRQYTKNATEENAIDEGKVLQN